ncbi:GPI mannosyltransferase 1 [Claviceps pazoutovae]|uniref:GPI mannosyltransferase 1 n=1 Tax=Claviceps pazoutovae TaxID=1649127 RepID=A0A9P7M7R2_9HYPO|nr:GPI mannosyltransferase 1 [Claviceps pazoutovae]
MPPLISLLRPLPLFLLALLLRLTLLLYGTWQDAHSAVKYTDIDYLVFTDASRLVSASQSPYARDTYRYTPLLAWLLLPTSVFFPAGKIIFALGDILAGWLMLRLLRKRGMSAERAGGFASLWLWNPMVATMSTRGSAEGLLGVLTVALLWAVEGQCFVLAGVVLGLGVHFKIYPFIWAPAILWWMDRENLGGSRTGKAACAYDDARGICARVMRFVSWERIKFVVVSLGTFMGLNVLMYWIYGMPFIQHTFSHHMTRLDHRHNFSPYNTLLYLRSAANDASSPSSMMPRIEALAFVPQLLLSCVVIPLVLAKKDLATSMMAQTFAFVTFNKVCTSQYFLWYMVFLPLYLPSSSLLRNPPVGVSALVLWLASQSAWLHQGYQLEFLGQSTFFPGLWASSLVFFVVNCWILGIVIGDGAREHIPEARPVKTQLVGDGMIKDSTQG